MPTFRRSATLEAWDGTVPELPEDFMARVRAINLVQFAASSEGLADANRLISLLVLAGIAILADGEGVLHVSDQQLAAFLRAPADGTTGRADAVVLAGVIHRIGNDHPSNSESNPSGRSVDGKPTSQAESRNSAGTICAATTCSATSE
jgi:hypothetical protein